MKRRARLPRGTEISATRLTSNVRYADVHFIILYILHVTLPERQKLFKFFVSPWEKRRLFQNVFTYKIGTYTRNVRYIFIIRIVRNL